MNSTTLTARRTMATALIVLSLMASSLVSQTAGAHTSPDRLTVRQIIEIWTATKQFRNVDAAVAAGYLPTEECSELPGAGGMGYHYVNPTYIADGVIDPTKPEILLFRLNHRGQLALAGVEYFAADGDQDLATDPDRPNLYGHPFDGPMPGHDPEMPAHYDLHFWLYRINPAGMLEPWNPRVTCPGAYT